MDGGGTSPFQCYDEIKKPSAYRVKKLTIVISKCQLKMVRKGMGRIHRFLAIAPTLTVTAM